MRKLPMTPRRDRPQSRRGRSFVAALTTLVLCASSVSSPALGADDKTVRAEYFERLAALAPRDATAHFSLAKWCQEQGLSAQAQNLLERVIRIDPDHAEARAQLGYRRHGLGWTLGEARPTSRATGSDSDSGASGASTGRAEDIGPPDASGAEGAPAVVSPEELVSEKKTWAREAAEKLGFEFNLYEDGDFLVHSTYRANSAEVRSFVDRLKGLKSLLARALGTRSSTAIWPDKLQFFYVRTLEAEKFSEALLQRRFPDRDGWDTIHDRALLLNSIPDDDLAHFLGRSAPARLGGSAAPVGWWIEEGLAGWLAAQTPEGKEAQLYQSAIATVHGMIEDDPEAFLLRDILETIEPDARSPGRGQALALTFVDFLLAKRRSGFGKLVQELKEVGEGDKLPAPDDDEALRSYMIEYILRQDELLKKHFRAPVDRLEVAWKLYVREKFQEQKEAAGAGTGGPSGRGRGGRGGGNNR